MSQGAVATPVSEATAARRVGWFEGLRGDRLCGWAYAPDQPHRALEVTLIAAGGARLIVRADRLRADLAAVGLEDCYHGFSASAGRLGTAGVVACVWSDDGTELPGSPFNPRTGAGVIFQAGGVFIRFDAALPGDPRLVGEAFERRSPQRRIRLGARPARGRQSETVATLYRPGGAGDGFHGFSLILPAPLRILRDGVNVIDLEHDQVLARLRPRSL
jgi:hypothetical protein